MALQKQTANISFLKGVDTKTDPLQISIDSFASLKNSVFNSVKRLTKRPGFPLLTTLPNDNQTTLTSFNNNLIATGSALYAFNKDANQWLNKGIVQPIQLSTQSLVKNSMSEYSQDAIVAENGLVCCAYSTNANSYYQISDSSTGEQITAVTLESTALNPRTYILGNYFIVLYMATISGAPSLRLIAIPLANVTSPRSPVTISSNVSSIADGFDAQVAPNNNLYVAWSAASNAIGLTFITRALAVAAGTTTTTIASSSQLVSLTTSASAIFLSSWDSSSTNGFSASFNLLLNPLMASTEVISGINIATLTSIISETTPSILLQVYYEVINTVTDLGSTQQDYVATVQVTCTTTGTGTVSSPTTILRSVGLGSKPFIANSVIYFFVAYGNSTSNQPTYFLIDSIGQIYMRLAYSNGGGYAQTQVLPNIFLVNGLYSFPYLYKDSITSVNKTTNSGLPTEGIYSQTGINLAQFSLNDSQQYSSQIANSLHLTGGLLWQYDGTSPVEHGFNVWPEDETVSTSSSGGEITAQEYFYQFLYEWTDAAGNIHRSAPSIPISVTTTGSTSTNTLYVPTLRLTYKENVRIVGYRYSTAQQEYYQFTSISSPILNDPTVDYVTITDTLADSSILGNALIYTTGSVIEDIPAPAAIASTLFDNRLWLVDAEDQNLLWLSKQVIESVPVEMSDLLTFYVAPTSGAQGSTGNITALAPMDDKLIIFKNDAIYYINGTGPDNTGANSQYSQPIFITSAVGCSNPNSIVLYPNGLMFQSDKGIWLLGRDLSTQYIGAPVEAYNSQVVLSAQSIPATNQIRFILNNNITLMYDYFVGQWGFHSNSSAISGVIYQGVLTYLNSFGQVLQETSGTWSDASEPVLMSLTTAWINVAGLQGFERAYYFYLLGTYLSPHKLQIQIAYDYAPPSQSVTISPYNFSGVYGSDPIYGDGTPYGGSPNLEQWRIFFQTQKCQAFQITINEIYDPSYGVSPGEGLTLSGLNLVFGTKKGYVPVPAAQSAG